MKVLNFGSLNIDHVYEVEDFVKPGETISTLSYGQHVGGKGLNQSVAASLAGADVYHAAMIGEGSEFLLDTLNNNAVNTDHVKRTDDIQGHAVIQVNESGENCIFLYDGSNKQLTTKYIDEVLSQFDEETFVVLQNETNLIDYIITKSNERGMKVVFNPSPVNKEIMDIDFNKVDWLLINEVEGKVITGKDEPENVLDYLNEKYPELSIVLTLGKKGSIVRSNNMDYRQDIFNVETVDTTGAGDTFTGYFISSIINGNNIPDALLTASAASAISVTQQGASTSIPTIEEVREFIDKRRKK